MIYLDTNVLLYATLSKVDTKSQQNIATNILETVIGNQTLILSNLNLNLLEYAFVMKKAKEDDRRIKGALEIFQTFVRGEKDDFSSILIDMLNDEYAYKNSFDIYHIAFAKACGCSELLTFDKGFKKFLSVGGLAIKVL